ncbi:uncharacterized protein LOC120326017 [Styela clava]
MFRYSVIVAFICIFGGVCKGSLFDTFCGNRETNQILKTDENINYYEAENVCKGRGMEIGNICNAEQDQLLQSQISAIIPDGSSSLRIWTGMKTTRNDRILLKSDNPPITDYHLTIRLFELWNPAFKRGKRTEGKHIMYHVSKRVSAPGCQDGDSNAELIMFDPLNTADGVLCRIVQ